MDQFDLNSIDSFLIDTDDTITTDAVLESATLDDGNDSTELTAAAESAIFLDAMYQECESFEEFKEMVEESAIEWELNGLIESSDAAFEAVKRIQIENFKQVNLDRETRRECIRLAKANDDPNYPKYAKYRKLMREYRDKIFQRWETKARTNARKSISRSKTKAAASKGKKATQTVKKLDNALKRVDKNGRNGTAIKERGH